MLRRAWTVVALLAGCGRTEPARSRTNPTTPPASSPAPAPAAAVATPCDGASVQLAVGLTHEIWPIAATPALGDRACFDLVRIDLAHYRLQVLTAAHDGGPRTAPDWLDAFHLAGVINAGMFETNNAPIGLLVENDVEVGHENAKLGGVLAFDPRDPEAAPAIVTGKSCSGYDRTELRKRYRSIVEGYRLIDCDGSPIRWADSKQYSAAAIGMDRAGHAVMIHARPGVTMTELARAVSAAGPNIAGALFVEGGPEASVVVHGDRDLRALGSYETGFHESDDNHEFWTLPNVVGAVAR